MKDSLRFVTPSLPKAADGQHQHDGIPCTSWREDAGEVLSLPSTSTVQRVIQSVARSPNTCRAVEKPNASPTFTSQSQALPSLTFLTRH